jgi:hypothetical protein
MQLTELRQKAVQIEVSVMASEVKVIYYPLYPERLPKQKTSPVRQNAQNMFKSHILLKSA